MIEFDTKKVVEVSTEERGEFWNYGIETRDTYKWTPPATTCYERVESCDSKKPASGFASSGVDNEERCHGFYTCSEVSEQVSLHRHAKMCHNPNLFQSNCRDSSHSTSRDESECPDEAPIDCLAH